MQSRNGWGISDYDFMFDGNVQSTNLQQISEVYGIDVIKMDTHGNFCA